MIATRLASFAVEHPAEAIPEAVRSRARTHLLDTLGCGLGAVALEAGRHASAIAVDQGGRPEASLLGEELAVPAPLAALANGTRCHALDFDDTHEQGICHASTVVAPAALAVGEARQSAGASVLDAYILGSEIALRIATATADGLYDRGFHPTSVCGAFGAAGAASRLLGLGAEETANALGVVGSFASGLFEYLSDGSATKPLHAGWGAHAGIQAARLAQAGATGPTTVIEGRFGLMRSHTETSAGAESICNQLGHRWEVAELAIKPFPACHFTHSSTWAAGELAEEHGLSHGDVATVFVRVPAEGAALVLDPLTAKLEPMGPYDAKFSLPFTVAYYLVHGTLDLTAFSTKGIRDEEVLDLARRVRPEPIGPGSPTSRFAGGVRIVTHDGVELDRFLDHAPGSPRNPLAEAWVRTKFRSNAELSLDPEGARKLMGELSSIDEAPSLDRATALLRSARAQAADQP